MKQVVAKQEVHIRSGKPHRLTDNKKGMLYPGFAVEVMEEVDGERIEGNSLWYKDRNGDFYWSGGFEAETDTKNQHAEPDGASSSSIKFQEIIESAYDAETFQLASNLNYNALIQLPKVIRENRGRNVKIGVLDHPIPERQWFFKHDIKRQWDGHDVHDHHGIFMAGLIAGAFENTFSFKGVAPESRIISFPLYKNGFFLKDEKLIENLRPLTGNTSTDRFILNISHSWASPSSALIEFFRELARKHILIASAGENEQLQANSPIQWPASLDEVIAVGSISEPYLSITFNKQVDLLVPDWSFISYSHDAEKPFFKDQGDSCSTAVVAGITALLMSNDHEIRDKTTLMKALKEFNICKQINDDAFSKLTLLNPHV